VPVRAVAGPEAGAEFEAHVRVGRKAGDLDRRRDARAAAHAYGQASCPSAGCRPRTDQSRPSDRLPPGLAGRVDVELARAVEHIPAPNALSGGTVWEPKPDGYLH
jgi:hypothetical protein